MDTSVCCCSSPACGCALQPISAIQRPYKKYWCSFSSHNTHWSMHFDRSCIGETYRTLNVQHIPHHNSNIVCWLCKKWYCNVVICLHMVLSGWGGVIMWRQSDVSFTQGLQQFNTLMANLHKTSFATVCSLTMLRASLAMECAEDGFFRDWKKWTVVSCTISLLWACSC